MLQDERVKMFRALAARACSAASRLGVGRRGLSGAESDAAYLDFFTRLIEELEESAKRMDDLVAEEFRELIDAAITRVFSNLARINPSLDFEEVLKPVPNDQTEELMEKVRGNMLALISTFRRAPSTADEGNEEDEAGDPLADESSF